MCHDNHKDNSTQENYLEIITTSSRPTSKIHSHPVQVSPEQTLTYLQPQQQLILLMQPHLQPQVYIDQYNPIASGAFSQVYSGFIRDKKQQLIPIVLKKCKFNKRQWEQRYTTRYESEVEGLWMLSSCPFVVRLYCAFYSQDQRLCLVLQRCVTTLENSMNTIRNNHNLAIQVFRQMIEYLAFAHNIKQSHTQEVKYRGTFLVRSTSYRENFATVIHKDIKPDNILVRQLSENSITIAVADLGMAELSPSHATSFNMRFGGTLRYQSPEMHMKKQYDSRVDCWSFGILVRSLFTEVIRLQAMTYEARINIMKVLSSNLRNDLKDLDFREKEVVLCILEHSLAFGEQKRWNSHQLKTVWDNYDLVHRILLQQKRSSKQTRQALFDLITIHVKLIEEANSYMKNLHKKCLQKILQCNKRLVCEILELNPLLVPEVLASSKFLFANHLTDAWIRDWESGQFLFARLRQGEGHSGRVGFKNKQSIEKLVDLMISYTKSGSPLALALKELSSAIAALP